MITINYSLVPDSKGKFSLDYEHAAVSPSDAKLVITSKVNFGFAPDTGNLAVSLILGSVIVPNPPLITGLKWDKKNQFTAKNDQLDPFARWLVQTINSRQAGFDPTDPIPVFSPATFTITPPFAGKFPGIESPVDGYIQFVFQEVTPVGKDKVVAAQL